VALVRCTCGWLSRPPSISIDSVSLTTSASFRVAAACKQKPLLYRLPIWIRVVRGMSAQQHSFVAVSCANVISMIYATTHDMYGILRNLPGPGPCLLDRQCTSESNSGGAARIQQPNCSLESLKISHRPINVGAAIKDAYQMSNVLARPKSLHPKSTLPILGV
jgi:hypothetical protein